MYNFSNLNIVKVKKSNKSPLLYRWLSKRYGINISSGLSICSYLGFSRLVEKASLSDVELYEVQQFIESSYKLDSYLKKEKFLALDNLLKLKTYRGLRHKEGLPVRGQKSRNGRTQRRLRSRISQL